MKATVNIPLPIKATTAIVVSLVLLPWQLFSQGTITGRVCEAYPDSTCATEESYACPPVQCTAYRYTGTGTGSSVATCVVQQGGTCLMHVSVVVGRQEATGSCDVLYPECPCTGVGAWRPSSSVIDRCG